MTGATMATFETPEDGRFGTSVGFSTGFSTGISTGFSTGTSTGTSTGFSTTGTALDGAGAVGVPSIPGHVLKNSWPYFEMNSLSELVMPLSNAFLQLSPSVLRRLTQLAL